MQTFFSMCICLLTLLIVFFFFEGASVGAKILVCCQSCHSFFLSNLDSFSLHTDHGEIQPVFFFLSITDIILLKKDVQVGTEFCGI